jgi:DNA-binding winged helix-turn-helix (wHTH) protein
MASPARPPLLLCFGEFEVNAASEELRKAGTLLKIHPQPFRVLLLLVEHSGRIVAREEIQRHLWGDNTYVDFEAGINFCIKQVRDALADDAESPRYIETIPRHGYRFIAAVSRGHLSEQIISFPHVSSVDPRIAPGEVREASALASEVQHVRPSVSVVPRAGSHKVALRVATAVFALVAIVIAVALTRSRRPPKLTEKDTVVLAGFRNTTGDPVFDDALRQALAMELEQSPFLNVLSETKARATLRLMNRPVNDALTLEVSRELCQRAGSPVRSGQQRRCSQSSQPLRFRSPG